MTVRLARRRGILVGALVAALATGGCSSVPDAANPVEWYKGTRDWITGDDKVEAAKQAEVKPVPGADKAFPSLASVPKRPSQTTAAERQKMADTLIADRQSARYTDDQFRRQDSSVAAGTVSRPAPAPAPQASASGQVASRPGPSPAVPAPPAIPASPMPVIPNQPIPVIPNQPVPVAPNPPVAVQSIPPDGGQPRPPPAVQIPAVPSTMPPPPPAIVGENAPPPGAFPPRPLGIPTRPPDINPSGGSPGFAPPPPPAQRGGVFVEADRFAPRFPNEVSLPRQPAFETGQSLEPNTSPVATIMFEDGSARIGGRDRRIIRRVYNEYRQRGGRIHIIGHASSRTRNLDQASHQLANFSISYARARSVAQVLERLGVSAEAITVSARSDQQPAFIEVMPAGEAGNRRAEIFFEN